MLNLRDHKAGWPIPILFGVPSTDFVANTASPRRTKTMSSAQKTEPTLYDYYPKIRPSIYAYIFSICEAKKFHSNTKHHTLFLLQRYIDKIGLSFNEDVQLLALICILISSKLIEVKPIKFEDLHRFSNHCYTNKEIIMKEYKVLETFHYKIFFRKYLISDKLEVYTLLLSCLHPADRISDLVKVSNCILDLLYEDIKVFEHFTSQRHLVASSIFFFAMDLILIVLHAALLILTQYNGRFPLTWRMSMIIKINEDGIILGAIKILKHVLSKDFFKAIRIE